MKSIKKYIFIVLLLTMSLCLMCTFPNKESNEKRKPVVGLSDEEKLIDRLPLDEFNDFYEYFKNSMAGIGDSVFSEIDDNDCNEIPLRLLNKITGLGLDTVYFAKKICAIGNLNISPDYYSLFYKLSCLAGAKCEIFYISNFTKNGILLFNEEIAINRIDMGNEYENFFRFIKGDGLHVKTVVNYYSDDFDWINDTIIFKKITIKMKSIEIKEFTSSSP